MSIHPLIATIKLFFKIWPSKSKVKVIAHSHTLGITSYRLISLSFHVDGPFSTWDTAIQIIDLEKVQGHGWGQSLKSQHGSNIQSTHIPLVPCQLALPFLRYSIFKVWPWKSKVKVIAQGHKEGIPPYRFISFSFHINRPSHSWDTAILKFDIKNSRSRSWVRSKFKVTTWVQHSVNSHPFLSMSIGHPIPELRLFQNLTLKIKGQGHGWGQSWKSQHSVDSHPFRSMWIGHPIPELRLFQNLTLKIKGQGHGWGHSSKSQCGSNILSAHISFIPCQTGIPFLSYDFFENLTLKIKGQGDGWGHSSKSQCGFNILSIHIPFVPCQSALPFLRYSIFNIWPWKSRVKVKWPWCCTATGLDNSIELRMVQIHSGVSEIWVR